MVILGVDSFVSTNNASALINSRFFLSLERLYKDWKISN